MQPHDDALELGTTMTSEISPGQMLKQARESKKLSHIDIAKQLKLRVQWIVDIENNHYTDASALIYVRGYLRSYARIVNVSAEEVIAAFDRMKFDEPFLNRKLAALASEEQFVMQQPVLSYNKSRSRRGFGKKMLGWSTLVLGLVAVVVAVVWWRGEPHSAILNAQSQPQVVLPEVPAETVEPSELSNPADRS